MSPQGQQAQTVLQKMQTYNPKRDTKSKSLWKHYSRQAQKSLQSGVLPENERRFFLQKFAGVADS